MPGSVTSVFSEPGDFEAALREEGGLGLLITGRGQFRARLTQVKLHRLCLSAAEEQLSRIAFVAVPADLILVSLPIDGRPAPIWGGVGMPAGEIMTLGPGQRIHARTDGPSHSGSIWLPVQDLVRYGRALIGAAFAVPSAARSWRSRSAAGRELCQLHGAGTRMAESRPETLIGAEAAHGLEQQLIHALVECLSTGPAYETAPATLRHQDIVVRFEGLLQAQPERDLRIGEICAALGVSERTLRSVCAEHLGVSPTSYLRLRRMSLVYRALWRGDPDAASVSEVARRYGFRNLGRFAASYRALFGELPSATLRRSLHPEMAHLVLRRSRRRL
ncbi:MAG: helix-turn-helix transcriptional regulator [Stellaceae bacterium]